MKIYYKVLNRIKNNKLKLTNVGGIVSLAFGLRYGKINSIPTNFSLNYIPQVEKVHNFFNEDVQIMETKDNIIKTGDILLVSDKRISNGSKSALAIRSGEISKTNAGARAKADARKNVKARKQNSGSAIIPGAQALVPQNTYCRYHQYAPPSCKVRVTPGPGHDQDPGQDIPPPSPSEDSPFDESKYKGGSSPFLGKFNYDNLNHSRGNVDFSNKRRMSHSYDGHAKKCFGMQENRNKRNLEKFQNNILDYIQSPETKKINGSYRYETPAYHYKKPNEDLVVTVNATNNQYISVRNATDFQLEKLELDGNLGYNSRPSMSVTLRLRGPGT